MLPLHFGPLCSLRVHTREQGNVQESRGKQQEVVFLLVYSRH